MKRTTQRDSEATPSGHRLAHILQKSIAYLGVALLAGAILGFATAAGLSRFQPTPRDVSGFGEFLTPTGTPTDVTTPTCGSEGLPACPQVVTWIPIKSHAPADLIAAARKSTLFNVDRSGSGDFLKDLSLLGTPVYVQGIQKMAGETMPDYYVIPILDPTGAAMGAADLQLNPPQTAIDVDTIYTYSPTHPGGAIPRISVQQAIAAVAAQRHTAMQAGSAPQLIDFTVNARALETGEIVWHAGGLFPADPLWLIVGTNGQHYVVGDDGHAYLLSELPRSSL